VGVADKGIIFSAPMVRALLEGRKTQTRRLLRNPEFYGCPTGDCLHNLQSECDAAMAALSPKEAGYAGGDRLYVRERLWVVGDGIRFDEATGDNDYCYQDTFHAYHPGRDLWLKRVRDDQRAAGVPSIHMPRWASRLWLLVTDVRVQRLRDINEADARAEGVADYGGPRIKRSDGGGFISSPELEFGNLWNSLHAKPGERWADNPWIVAVSFTVNRGNIDG
jgi:hypothetical protein